MATDAAAVSGDLAGRLRERVSVSREEQARDPLGAGGVWSLVGEGWAEVRPEARGALFAGDGRSALPAWRVTMRPVGRGNDMTVGDRIGWGERTMIVREARVDPALSDRIVAIAEEER
jgi:head-tail adaptor